MPAEAQISSREMAHAYLSGTIRANRPNAQKSTGPRTLSISLDLPPAKPFAKASTLAACYMQNKPNFQKAEMSVSSAITKDYENKRLRPRRGYKPNQTQSPHLRFYPKKPTLP